MPEYKIHNNRIYTDVTSDYFIEIVNGGFTGVHFNFGKIEFAGEDEQGNGKVNFDYNLLYIPDNIILDIDRPLLEKELGIILENVLETMVQNSQTSESGHEVGTGDTESTDEGRGVSSEGDSISER